MSFVLGMLAVSSISDANEIVLKSRSVAWVNIEKRIFATWTKARSSRAQNSPIVCATVTEALLTLTKYFLFYNTAAASIIGLSDAAGSV